MKRVALKIYGQVQGVFFRANAREKAQKLGLNIEAENMPDGTVYIVIKNNNKNIKKFIDWCKKGPELAKVERVKIS